MNTKTKNEALERLSADGFKSAAKAPLHIVLDNVRSAQNIGSIFRTMDAFRCVKLHLCGISATPPHREINKTALGATETVDWEYYETTMEAINRLKDQNVIVYAIEQTQNALMLNNYQPDYSIETAFVLGNEVSGVSQEVIDAAGHSIEIPQFGSKHSLNISVCAGIIIWQATNGFPY